MSEPAPGPSRSGLRGQSRTVLLAGFGGLLLIMVFAGADSLQVLSRIRDGSATIQHEFRERSRGLNQIRSDVYLSGTFARDYLLEPEPAAAEKNRSDLYRLRQEMESTLTGYEALMAPDERKPLNELRQSLAEYWRVLDPALKWSPEQRRQSGFPFLRDQVFPHRVALLNLADQIETVNERQLDSGNLRVAALFSGFRARLGLTLAVTLVLGILFAVFASRRLLDLERQAASRYAEVIEARGQLKNLSARLVQTQEEERRVLSRELHDEVGQSLSAILVGLSNLSAAIRIDSKAQMESEVLGIRRVVEGTVRLVRNITLLLRPSMLDDLGLIPALEWQAREVSRRTGLRVDVVADDVSDDLPEDFKTCIYRVVQEAMHNIERHASAALVRISVRQEPHRLLLSIKDDGLGFDAGHSRGLGLLGMEERVTHLGGTLRLASQPGRGTTVSVILILAAADSGTNAAA